MIIEVGLCQNTVKFWQIMGIIITIAKMISTGPVLGSSWQPSISGLVLIIA